MSMAAQGEPGQLGAGEEMIFMDTFVKGHLGSCRMQGNICKGGKGEMASLVIETNRIHFVFSYLL